MKNTVRILVLTVLISVLFALPVCAEPSETLSNIFSALTAEGSSYNSRLKEGYAEYFPDTVYEETLDDTSFTITISGNEYFGGSWTFVEEGDYLTLTSPSNDLLSLMFVSYVIHAVADCYGMDSHLVSRYITGMNANQIENDWFIFKEDEDAGTASVSVYIAGPYDMKELDQIVLNDAVLDFEPLGESFLSMATSAGKFMMIANGSVDDVDILIGENGGLDDMAYESIANVVRVLQPKNWEAFLADYTELADAEGAGWSVKLEPDGATVREIYEDISENDSFVLIHFGE